MALLQDWSICGHTCRSQEGWRGVKVKPVKGTSIVFILCYVFNAMSKKIPYKRSLKRFVP